MARKGLAQRRQTEAKTATERGGRAGQGRKGGERLRQPKGMDAADGKVDRWSKASEIPLDDEEMFDARRYGVLEEREGRGSEEELYIDDSAEVFAPSGSDTSDDEQVAEAEDQASEVFEEPIKKVKKGKQGEKKVEEEFDASSWGSKKYAYYTGNGNERKGGQDGDEEQEEEDAELLEQEAMATQRAQRALLHPDLFTQAIAALDKSEDSMIETKPDAEEQNEEINNETIDTTTKEYIEKNSPETLALIREYATMLPKVEESWLHLKESRKNCTDDGDPQLGFSALYHDILTTYLSLLAFYICMRCQTKENDQLRQHPILQRLYRLREGLNQLQALGLDLVDADEDVLGLDQMMDADDSEDGSESQSEESRSDGGTDEEDDDSEQSFSQEESEQESLSEPLLKKAKRNKQPRLVQDLVEPEYKGSAADDRNDKYMLTDALDHLEQDELDAYDAEKKAKRNRSLQFHTSRLTKADVRRQGGRLKRAGGDEDLPYGRRERRQTVKPAQGEALDPVGHVINPEPSKHVVDQIAALKAKRKIEQKTEYDAARLQNRVVEESAGDGPRGLNRQILLNKTSLPAKTAKAKANQNPRVKKRMQFDKAQKKLSSMKPTYKGGLSGQAGAYGERGSGKGYEGEKSGISRGVKSVKL